MEPKNVIKDIYAFLDAVDNNENLNQDEQNHKTSKILIKTATTEQKLPKKINNKITNIKFNSWDSNKPKKAEYVGLKNDHSIQTKKKNHDFHNALNEKKEDRRLIAQKKEYEKAIKRHLSFIEMLLEEKKSLMNKCEDLVKELKLTKEKFENKSKTQEEKYKIELQKIKELMTASEKLKREKWIEEQTEKIKEITMKGMEPEIKKILCKHKEEIKKLKKIHELQLSNLQTQVQERALKEIEIARSNLNLDIEKACIIEHEFLRIRFEKDLDQIKKINVRERESLLNEIEKLKHQLKLQQEEYQSELDRIKQEKECSAVKELEERLLCDYENKQQTLQEKYEKELQFQEHKLQAELKQVRDQEIDKVLRHLEEETTAEKEEIQKKADCEMRKLHEQYRNEIKNLQLSEQQKKLLCENLQENLNKIKEDHITLQRVNKLQSEEAEKLKETLRTYKAEKENLYESIKSEFADKLAAAEKLVLNLTEQNKQIVDEKNKTLEDIHLRVKTLIEKKDESIEHLKAKYEASVSRAEYFEDLLLEYKNKFGKIKNSS